MDLGVGKSEPTASEAKARYGTIGRDSVVPAGLKYEFISTQHFRAGLGSHVLSGLTHKYIFLVQ